MKNVADLTQIAANKHHFNSVGVKLDPKKTELVINQVAIGGPDANWKQFVDNSNDYNSIVSKTNYKGQNIQNKNQAIKKTKLNINTIIIVEDEPLQMKYMQKIFQENADIENIFIINPKSFPHMDTIRDNIDFYSKGKKPLLLLDNDYGAKVNYCGINLFYYIAQACHVC